MQNKLAKTNTLKLQLLFKGDVIVNQLLCGAPNPLQHKKKNVFSMLLSSHPQSHR